VLHHLLLLKPPDTTFPSDLPVPVDDGACAHLVGTQLPATDLPSTSGSHVDLSSLSGRTIIFCYPRTGAPGETIPDEWNAIPGARGCTPQACAFRDERQRLSALGVKHLFGLPTQDTAYQLEAEERNHLPYELCPTRSWSGRGHYNCHCSSGRAHN
jgi:peroxiredoxin